jgi:SAM-dependent methyltransferase
MSTDTHSFDGIRGRIAAKVMARGNRAPAAEAIAILDPAPDHAVLAIGFGAGVGVALLAARLHAGRVAGVDPSRVMLDEATRRNRAAIKEGRVDLQLGTADALPWDDASFDGAIAVNSIQLWDPLEGSVAEVARVLRPGGRLVTITHDWALRHHYGTLDRWEATAGEALVAAGFVDIQHRAARAERGRARVLCATRAGDASAARHL